MFEVINIKKACCRVDGKNGTNSHLLCVCNADIKPTEVAEKTIEMPILLHRNNASAGESFRMIECIYM